MIVRTLIGAVVSAALLASAAPAPALALGDDEAIDFNRDIRPILSNKCVFCHGPDEAERQAGLRLDREADALADRGGYAAVVPGDPDASELIYRVESEDGLDVMPPPGVGKAVTPEERALLRRWVEQGAEFQEHWSYVPPDRPALPEVSDETWPTNPIDRFVLSRIEAEGLAPSPEADRAALIRRVSLDLTGLPPTLEEVDAFLADESADAYEDLVDRLLASQSYGEHQARLWLDLARYADSAGYADDPSRTIWAYRDWVIDAFNDNLPFDRFTVEQVAGDLLPEPTERQLIATAFHRNTMTNSEGGTDDEEFRNAAIVDRVNTTMTVWMGTSMACAQCHTHKYDPISQVDYFRLFAILNSTADADQRDESPTLPLFTEEQEARKADWEREAEALRNTLSTPTPELRYAQLDWERSFPEEPGPGSPDAKTPEEIRTILAIDPADRTEEQAKKLSDHFLSITPILQSERDRLAELERKLTPYTTVPIMRELPEAERRTTHIQRRGNFLDLGEEVAPDVPESFHPLPDGEEPDRLGLARWLVSGENPLTGRVIANRCWEQVFGRGLVGTSEEFGSQGDPPTHPELLDWLATELVRSGWDLKASFRLLVTSSTYRQSSTVSPRLLDRDPDNALLARGPRFRLSAEMIRDQALFVSGLLSPRMYGPPVNPPRPETGLRAAFGSAIDRGTSEGQDRYRRALYTEWRRSNPYPSMTTFDAPNREICIVRRDRTNTPLQALVTLNDPVYIEAAQALARRMVAEGGDSTEDQARHGFRLCLAREPSTDELDRILSLFEDARSGFSADGDAARAMATDPLGPLPEGMDPAELAAWTVVGNVLLNLDEMFLKR
ncbi:PSD1 and planctomycete cytochrome C domain-containing protein [Tautonia plasticadhaerens]|uniref:Planctomycete cytochrome C n=1 Tax=Tautonia plasticadhaerens TaxID=2527974 RepID=A0A518H4Z6_9BACT|nr:PSD1 and planctomycete cytochrome C domain-containing protein [Tautonia plasticadhaerens]QDV35888.1 Planctomycete cytochrome C [Tautonia plasticadhaerens]